MRSLRFVMALCAMLLVSSGCHQVQEVYINSGPTAPTGVTQCNDGKDNADPEDTLADRDDPGCSYPQGYYDPNDNDETDGPSGPSGLAAPGAFNLHGTCSAGRAKLTWSPSDRVEHYEVWHWTWTTRQGLAMVLQVPGSSTSVELGADPSAANYWQLIAVNNGGRTTSASPDERDDKTATFACGAPAPPPVATPTPGNPTPPGGTTPPGTTNPNPPSGGACSGMSWSASATSGPRNATFTVSINSGGCQVVLESSAPDNVSVNNSGGRFLNSGSANVCLRSIAGLAPSICQTMTTQ